MKGAVVCLTVMLIGPSLVADEASPSIVGIWVMGQSLGDGSESLPLVTPADTGWGNLNPSFPGPRVTRMRKG